jgi:8-oxo-dGTP pyrophosphatase MutT (NUDIX family)
MRAETYIKCALRETYEETGVSLYNHAHTHYQKMSAGEYYFFDVESELETCINDSLEIEEVAWLSPIELEALNCNVDVNYWLTRRHRPTRP